MGFVYMGGILPCFPSLFRLSLLLFISCCLFVFLCFSPIFLGQGQTTAIYLENREFHSDPVCTDPVQNFPIEASAEVSSTVLRGSAGLHGIF